jgi:hypothetical protein
MVKELGENNYFWRRYGDVCGWGSRHGRPGEKQVFAMVKGNFWMCDFQTARHPLYE